MSDSNTMKKFIYVAPALPPNLVNCSTFTIDFMGRKFLHVGLDPTRGLTIMILIITPAHHILITTDILNHIFHLMENISSYLLSVSIFKRNIFLDTEVISLYNMMYKSKNVLVLETKTYDGCRILFNRQDLNETTRF